MSDTDPNNTQCTFQSLARWWPILKAPGGFYGQAVVPCRADGYKKLPIPTEMVMSLAYGKRPIWRQRPQMDMTLKWKYSSLKNREIRSCLSTLKHNYNADILLKFAFLSQVFEHKEARSGNVFGPNVGTITDESEDICHHIV